MHMPISWYTALCALCALASMIEANENGPDAPLILSEMLDFIGLFQKAANYMDWQEGQRPYVGFLKVIAS